MSLEFISRRTRVETTTYSRVFDWAGATGAGFAFECDAQGYIALGPLSPAGKLNLERCLTGEYDVIDRGIETYTHAYWDPAVVRCDCGERIYLDDPLTNACDACGLLCNGSGQRLAPVENWAAQDRYDVFGPQNGPDDY